MTAILLAYSATAYLFSGSVCYLTSFNQTEINSETSRLKRDRSKLTSLWIALLWPLWIVKETKLEHNIAKTKVNTIELSEYSIITRELTSVGSREGR